MHHNKKDTFFWSSKLLKKLLNIFSHIINNVRKIKRSARRTFL
jgi:hypothetical protein